jgi:hypothetical protein
VALLGLLSVAGCGKEEQQGCASGYRADDQGRCQPEDDAPNPAPDDDTAEPDEHPFFDVGPKLDCEDPVDEVSYVEVGAEWGLNEPAVWMGEHAENGSVAVADFDGDGDRDVVMGFDGQPPVFYRREGIGFVAEDLPVVDGLSQIGLADFDNDGRLDLAFGGMAETILLNTEEGWVPVAFPGAQWEDETGRGHIKSIQPMDIDRDGIQDAYALVSASDASGVASMDFIAWGVGDGSFIADTTVVPEDWGYQKGLICSGLTGTMTAGRTCTSSMNWQRSATKATTGPKETSSFETTKVRSSSPTTTASATSATTEWGRGWVTSTETDCPI